MALQRLAAFFQDQYFQAKGHRKPVMLIGPRTGEGRCLVIGYEATQRMRVRQEQGSEPASQLVSCWPGRCRWTGCRHAQERAHHSQPCCWGGLVPCRSSQKIQPSHAQPLLSSPSPHTLAGQQAGHGVP